MIFMRADNAYALPPRESKEEFAFHKNLLTPKAAPKPVRPKSSLSGRPIPKPFPDSHPTKSATPISTKRLIELAVSEKRSTSMDIPPLLEEFTRSIFNRERGYDPDFPASTSPIAFWRPLQIGISEFRDKPFAQKNYHQANQREMPEPPKKKSRAFARLLANLFQICLVSYTIRRRRVAMTTTRSDETRSAQVVGSGTAVT
jgi:hypothetical protein